MKLAPRALIGVHEAVLLALLVALLGYAAWKDPSFVARTIASARGHWLLSELLPVCHQVPRTKGTRSSFNTCQRSCAGS